VPHSVFSCQYEYCCTRRRRLPPPAKIATCRHQHATIDKRPWPFEGKVRKKSNAHWHITPTVSIMQRLQQRDESGIVMSRRRGPPECLLLALLLLLGPAPSYSFAPSCKQLHNPTLTSQPLHDASFRIQSCPCNSRKENFYPLPYRSRRSSVRLASLSSIPVSLGGAETLYMLLLAVQFAVQPILTKRFAPQKIIKSTYVLAQDLTRLVICLSLLWMTGGWATATSNWTFTGAWIAAGFPAFLYMVQSYCSLTAYQNLSPITYNVLNQTKTLSAAAWCYILMRQLQSRLQIVSLFVLLSAALVMERVVPLPFSRQKQEVEPVSESSSSSSSSSSRDDKLTTHLKMGVLPVLAASLISGLAGAWTQKNLQQTVLLSQHTNSLLRTVEMSFFSALFLLATLAVGSPDRVRAKREGWTVGWTIRTWIPIVTNAAGGVLVGLVTKYAGSVRKGFALILGMLFSGLLQNYLQSRENGGDGMVTAEQWVGGALAALSLWMHSKFR
jgi:UDP-sugar transporter A1/2/3